ncbi:hypothetical protein [Streptomyces nigrescens]
MPRNKAEQAEVNARRAELIRLRRAKTPYTSDLILGLGYTSASDARKDFYRALQERKAAVEAEVEAYREEQNEVLEALMETYLPIALTEADIKAGEMVLKLLERQSKLNGWEAALKNEVSGPDGGAIPLGNSLAELNALIDTAGQDESPAEDTDGDTDS